MKNAEEVLKLLAEHLIMCIEELQKFGDTKANLFHYGEQLAYMECLECIQYWDKSIKYGLNFDIEKRYPL